MSLETPKFILLDPKFDFLSSIPPSKFYAIATTPRSGSSFFARKLWETGLLGAPAEYFNFYTVMFEMALRLNVNSIENYVDRLFELRTSHNGVFGTKLFPEFLEFMHIANILWRFPNMQFIYLERKDVLSQSVSLAIAQQTNLWSGYKSSELQPTYDYNLIIRSLNRIITSKTFWKIYFKKNKINPLRIKYENFIKNPDKIVNSILEHFGYFPDPSVAIQLPSSKKQADSTNLEWKDRFCSDVKVNNPELLKILRI